MAVSAAPSSAQTVSENFEQVAPPALPPGWTTDVAGLGAEPWVSAPRLGGIALTADQPSDNVRSDVVGPVWHVLGGAQRSVLSFSLVLQGDGFDTVELLVSINGAAYTPANLAGARYLRDPPLNRPGRALWNRTVMPQWELPPLNRGDTVSFRWSLTLDSSGAVSSLALDNVALTNASTTPPGPLPVAVPTLSEWALILFGLSLAGGAAFHLQRRRIET